MSAVLGAIGAGGGMPHTPSTSVVPGPQRRLVGSLPHPDIIRITAKARRFIESPIHLQEYNVAWINHVDGDLLRQNRRIEDVQAELDEHGTTLVAKDLQKSDTARPI